MRCFYFIDDDLRVCSAFNAPYIPSIAETEQYCFNANYKSCPVFKTLQQVEEYDSMLSRRRWKGVTLGGQSSL